MFNYLVTVNGKNYTIPELYNLFYGVEPSKKSLTKTNISLPADAFANENELIICYEMAGVKSDSIDIHTEKNELTVKAEKLAPNIEGYKVDRNDIHYGKCHRTFTIGSEYDLDKLEASYSDGILQVKIPRKPETRPKTFKVNVQNQLNP